MLAIKAVGRGGLEQQIIGGQGGELSALLGSGQRESMQRYYSLLKDWVWACASCIARRVAGCQYGAGKIESTSDDKAYAEFVATKSAWKKGVRLPTTIKQITAGGRAIEQYTSHEALDFLQKPNKLQGKDEFLSCTVFNLLITGEFYWVGGKTQDGNRELWCLPTTWIIPEHKGGLFTGYKLKPPGLASEGEMLDPRLVQRGYYPDPADFKKALSPVVAVLKAIRTDDFIQSSQVQMFQKGIFPNVILTVGDRVGPDGQNMGKPILSGAQRKQLIRSVMQVWESTTGQGAPAIVDGLISSINKLNAMPSEMDWLDSGDTVKKRIYQAFGLNPIVTGEITGANRAQAAVADQSAIDNVVNPMGNKISNALQDFVVPMFEADDAPEKGLALWLEEAKAKDDELDMRKIAQARAGGSASRNEERNVLGLPPNESPASELVGLAATAQGAASLQGLLTSVTMGQIQRESALMMMTEIYGLSSAQAQKMIGKVQPPAPIIPGAPGAQQPASGGGGAGPPGDVQPPKPKPEDKPDEGETLPEVNSDQGKGLIASKSPLPKLTRGQVKAVNARQRAKLEREAAVGLVPFFKRSTQVLLNDYLAEAMLNPIQTTPPSKQPV